MKNYIVGAFTRETWGTHGKRWLAAAHEHKGKADVLVMHTAPAPDTGDGLAKVVKYDGNLIAALAKMDGIYLYAAPNVRFQAEPTAMFEAAAEKFAVVERGGSAHGQQPFHGQHPVYESYWAAPYDLLDMLHRVVEMSFGTGCKPPYYETNYVSYFTEFFPWFRQSMPATEYMPVYDAQVIGDYHADPRSMKRLTAVGLDKPESKKVGVLSGIVKPGKPLLTTKPEKTMMTDQPSSVT